MKFSQLLHVTSVITGFIGVALALTAAFLLPSGASWLGMTREFVIQCAMASLLVAIWVQIATIHHMALEKKGKFV